jgi:uncharacterized membrane protein
MAIEFQCTGCGQVLRVPDEAAGKQAKCPQCSNIMVTPAVSAPGSVPPLVRQPFTGSYQELDNPYASPQADTFGAPSDIGGFTTEPFSTQRAISQAWNLFKDNMGLLIVVLVLQLGIVYGVSACTSLAHAVIGGAWAQDLPFRIVVPIAISLINIFANTFLSLGVIRVNLNVCRGQPADVGMLFSGGPWLLRSFVGSILFYVVTYLGLIALIIPGVYFMVTYWAWIYFVVDRNASVGEAFSQCREHMRGYRGESLLMGIVWIALSLLGTLLCIVGLLFTLPIANLMFTIGYLMLTGQPVHQPNRAFQP